MVTENTTSSKRETRTINHAASGLEMANMLVLPYCILAGGHSRMSCNAVPGSCLWRG